MLGPRLLVVHPLLLAAAEKQWGLFTAADARRAGYGHDDVRSLCSTGAWVRLRRGVYVRADRLAAIEAAGARYRADCLAVLLHLGRPSAALSHASAARLHGVPLASDAARTVRLTDPRQWRQGEGYRMVRAPLDDRDVMTSGPFRLTTASRTLVDCARSWRLEDSIVAMDAALLRERTSPEALRRELAGQHQWPGAPNARRAIELADGRAESPLETLGRLRLVGAGLPPDELQVEIHVDGRLLAVVDAWYDDAAVAVEFDGRVKYTDPWRGRDPAQVAWEEKRREDAARRVGIRFTRIVDADLGPRWHTVETHLREQLAFPGPVERRFVARRRERGVVRRSA